MRAVREGETGGFPLIIYSLSLGNQAASTAKLSLPAPGPFEAGGCLSSLSGSAAPTCSRTRSREEAQLPEWAGKLLGNLGPTPPPRNVGLPARWGTGLLKGWRQPRGRAPSGQTLCPQGRRSKAWPRGQELMFCLAQGAGSLEDHRPLKSPGKGMLCNLQKRPLAWLRAAALINVLRSPSVSALGCQLLQLHSSPLVLREDSSNLSAVSASPWGPPSPSCSTQHPTAPQPHPRRGWQQSITSPIRSCSGHLPRLAASQPGW